MPWVRRAATSAAKLSVKYGPHVVAAWKVGGRHVTAAAQTARDDHVARRSAMEHAETIVDGTVLKSVHDGRRIWVVFSGDKPLTSYPSAPGGPDSLVADADLGKRQTPEQMREQAVAARARQAARQTARRVSRRNKE